MDCEEKYNAALGRAKEKYSACSAQAFLEYIFPELKESEDESIRNGLIALLKFGLEDGSAIAPGFNVTKEQALAWLEKQDGHKPYGQRKECEDCQFNYAGECKGYCALKRNEHKPTDEVKPKFHEGDWIVDKFGLAQQVLDFRGGIYTCTYNSFTIDCESNYHLWSIKDIKEGDVLYYEFNDTKNLFIVKSVGETKDQVEGHFCYYITRDGREVWDGRLLYLNIASMCNAMPATKEQRDLLFSKMKEVGYAWDGEKKKLSYKHLSIMKFRKIIEQVEELSISSYAKSHQITIDTIEEVIEDLRTDELCSYEAIIGSCLYKVNNLIEVMNPEYHYDIEVLTELLNILNSYKENN